MITVVEEVAMVKVKSKRSNESTYKAQEFILKHCYSQLHPPLYKRKTNEHPVKRLREGMVVVVLKADRHPPW